MEKCAYIITLPPDYRKWLEGSFRGGDDKKKADVMWNGELVRGARFRDCLLLHIRAPEELIACAPKKFVLSSNKKTINDFGNGPWGGFSLVSEKFVEIIESLEPGVNQFIKIDAATRRDGSPLGKDVYLMNVTSVVNAIDVSKSTVEFIEREFPPIEGGLGHKFLHMRFPDPLQVTISAHLVEGRALWRGTPSDINQIFISEGAFLKIREAGLSELTYQKVNVA